MTPNRDEILTNLRRVAEAAPEDLLHMRRVVEKTSCGTARCLAGWAMVDPWFQENTPILEILRTDYYGDVYGFDSFGLAKMCDIDQEDASNLFGGNLHKHGDPHAVSKAEVLWNIDELLANRSTRPYLPAVSNFTYTLEQLREISVPKP